MTAYDDIQTAKGAVDQLKEGANAINEWAEKATELAEAGKELTKVQGVLQGVKVFGKLGTGFAMAGIGLDLALFAFGLEAPDPNEMILNAISALDNKVDALWNAMDQQFDKIHTHLDTVSAKQRIQDEMEYFSALKKIIMVYRDSPPSGTQLLLDPIYSPAAIHKNFSGIHDAVMSDKADDNILKAEYDSTYGEASTIISTGKELLAVALLAPMAYALASALRHKKDPTFELATPYDVDKLFGKLINAISDQISKYTQMCWDDASTNVKKKMERDIFQKLKVPGNREIHTTFRESSKELCEVLKKQWPMFDWVVVVGRWDLTDYSKEISQEGIRLVWPNQKIKDCNVFVSVVGKKQKMSLSMDWYGAPRLDDEVVATRDNIAWNCYWTNSKRVALFSYHPKWLTDEQMKDLVSEQHPNGSSRRTEEIDLFLLGDKVRVPVNSLYFG
jgi:hypothetical protein